MGSTPAPPVNNYSINGYVDPTGVALGATWVNAAEGDGVVNAKRRTALKSWWFGLLINQQANIGEKMTMFWHNHFATETEIVQDSRFAYKYNASLRENALGNFKTLCKIITVDPAMLKYLNGYLNTKNAPDENYGRELQELFTLGKGAASQYTEADVKAAAKVLTGWRFDRTSITSFFDPTKHDTGNKQFSGFYNNTVITGKNGAGGATETDDLLNMIFAQNEVAKFLCRKIYRFFVYYDIDETVENEVISPLADIFRANNYEIKPVLDTLFKSQHFFDVLSRSCYIKTPVDMMVAYLKQFPLALPASTDYLNFYPCMTYFRAICDAMQQAIGDPPNVAGWPAFYQSPQFHELWINSDTLPKRNQFADAFVLSQIKIQGTNLKLQADILALAASMSNPGDPNILISDTETFLLGLPMGTTQKAVVKAILLSGQSQDHYWTDAWNDYKNNPGNMAYTTIVLTRLQSFYKTIVDLAEYQLS